MINVKLIHLYTFSEFKYPAIVMLCSLIMLCHPVYAGYGKYSEQMLVAENMLNQSRPEAASAIYKALILKDTSYIPAKLALGTLFARQAKYVESEKVFLGIINSKHKCSDAYERLAYNYYLWAEADPASETHFIKKGLQAIDIAIKMNPYNIRAYSTRGLLMLHNKDYNQALSNFQKALSINSSDQETITNMGILYTQLDKYSLALDYFERAIQIDTKNPRPYKELGIMLANSNQDRQAIYYLEKARFYDVFTTYQEHYLMATLQEKMGDLHQSIDEFTATLALKPDYVDCYTHIARLSEALGEDEKAIEAYKKAVALDYSILTAFIKNADNYLLESDLSRARPLFIKVLKIEPGNNLAFEGLASSNYLASIEGTLDHSNWYQDKQLLEKQIPFFSNYSNILKTSWVKFNIAKYGVTSENEQVLLGIIASKTETPEDVSAKGEALFLYGNYEQANEVLTSAIDKYVSYYVEKKSEQEAIEHLLQAANRLASYHEFFASKATYDKAIELGDHSEAVEGLSYLSKDRNYAEQLLNDTYYLEKTPQYSSELEQRLIQVIKLFPQCSKAHYMLSEHYAQQGKFDLALEQLMVYKDLMNIDPYPLGPGEKKVDHLAKHYYQIIQAHKLKEPEKIVQ